VLALALILWLGTRRMKLVPGRGQAALEFILNFVRNNIVIETLGEKDGKRFMPLIVSIFFLVLAVNITGVIPGLQIAGSATIGLPVVLAIVAYVVFIYAGIKKHGVGRYFKTQLFPAGVPWVLYILLTPVEFVSTFILRPITLTLRLLMNMVAGHMLLVLCFTATEFFFVVLANGQLIGLLGVGTFAFGIVFTLLELFVAVLQAYVFAILTAIYIQLSLAGDH
jgi:F-type H+-transporting ATPase subunit a